MRCGIFWDTYAYVYFGNPPTPLPLPSQDKSGDDEMDFHLTSASGHTAVISVAISYHKYLLLVW